MIVVVTSGKRTGQIGTIRGDLHALADGVSKCIVTFPSGEGVGRNDSSLIVTKHLREATRLEAVILEQSGFVP